MIDNLNILADRLRGIQVNGKDITVEDLKSYISSDEKVEVKSASRINLLTDAEIEEMKSTVGTGSKNQGYVDGMKAGAEQLVKAIRTEEGLEFEGKLKFTDDAKIDFNATAKHIAEPFKRKILTDANIEPEKKISDLEKSLKRVQDTYEGEKLTWEQKQKDFDQEKKKLKQNYFLETSMPDVEILKKKQLVRLFQDDGYSVDFDENDNPIPVRFGKPVKNNVEKLIPIETVFAEFIERNNWSKKPAGKGGKDDKPDPTPEFKTKNEVFAYLEKHPEIKLDSDEAQNMIKKVEKRT